MAAMSLRGSCGGWVPFPSSSRLPVPSMAEEQASMAEEQASMAEEQASMAEEQASMGEEQASMGEEEAAAASCFLLCQPLLPVLCCQQTLSCSHCSSFSEE